MALSISKVATLYLECKQKCQTITDHWKKKQKSAFKNVCMTSHSLECSMHDGLGWEPGI